MNKNVFVAGATGAIGRSLCRLLVQDGWTVTAQLDPRPRWPCCASWA